MADRVVKVTVRAAIDNYVQGMERVRKATADTAKESEKLEKVGQAAEKVGGAFLTVGAAATGAVLIVTKMAADFDAQMSKVQAATGATASEMDKFRNQALTAGAAFGYTATQVTEAQVELGKAGLATSQILGGGLNGVLALAASDNIELGKAAQIASVAMKQFNLTGADVPHIADELAAGAGKALGGVEQLGDALNQSGLVASNFGFSLEETTGILSAFADAGLLGSDSGTSLKTMLQALANPSKQSADLMKTLGINVKDANGNFLGAADLAQLLHDKLGTLSDAQRQQALAQIFGSDATRAATVLFKEAGDGIQGYIDQNNDAGYAMEQARIKSDNLNGDLKKLRSAFQAGLIDTGTSATGALRPLVQTMTNVVDAFNALPEPLKATALGATGVVGATSLLAGGMLFAIPKIVEFRGALATLREGGVTARSSLGGVAKFMTGPWGIALSVAASAAAIFAAQQLESAQYTQTLRDSLNQTTGALTKNTSELVANALAAKTSIPLIGEIAGSSAFDKAKRLGIGLDTVTKAAQGNTRAYRELLAIQKEIRGTDDNDFITKKYGEGLSAASGDITELVQAVQKQRKAVKDSKEQFGQLAEAQADSKGGSEQAASGLDAVTNSAEDATQAISDTSNAIKGFNSGQLDANSAQRDFEAAIDAVTESIENNGKTLDVHDEKGRQNAATLDSIAQSTLNYAGALYQQTGSQDQATKALDSGRSSLIAALGQYGITGKAAQDYADKILGTPTDWATLFTNNANGAKGPVDSLNGAIRKIPGQYNSLINVNVSGGANVEATKNAIDRLKAAIQSAARVGATTPIVAHSTGPNVAFASGGRVVGPGTGKSDSIPAMLSNGEYVIRQKSVSKYGTGFLDAVNRGRFADGGLVGVRTTQDKAAKARYSAAKAAQRKASSAFSKAQTAARKAKGAAKRDADRRLADARAALARAQQETRDSQKVAQRAAAALTAAKNAPTGPDLGDRISFRSSVRAGEYSSSDAVRDLYAMGQDSGKYGKAQRTRFLDVANRSETAMLRLQKRSDAAGKSVELAADKLDDLKSSAKSMADSVSGKLSDFSFGNYRSGSSLLRGLTSRAGKLKQFQSLLVTLQKNGLAPALLNEIASLGVDEGLPLAKSLSSMSKGQLSAINSQYGSIGKTSTAIGNQVADANYGKLIDAAERQLSAANKNAAAITKAINDQSKSLQKLIGKALGLPGYSTGGYTGDYGTGQVAGLVHGREFVMNAYATAANRPLLEAMNRGGNVRYMDTTRTVAAAPTAAPQLTQVLDVKPMQHVDPNTMMTVLGREAARQFAGMVM